MFSGHRSKAGSGRGEKRRSLEIVDAVTRAFPVMSLSRGGRSDTSGTSSPPPLLSHRQHMNVPAQVAHVENSHARHMSRTIAKAEEQFYRTVSEFVGVAYIPGYSDFVDANALRQTMEVLEGPDGRDDDLDQQIRLMPAIMNYLQTQPREILMRESIQKDYVVSWFVQLITPLRDFLIDTRVWT
jgi:hypothetical protein